MKEPEAFTSGILKKRESAREIATDINISNNPIIIGEFVGRSGWLHFKNCN